MLTCQKDGVIISHQAIKLRKLGETKMSKNKATKIKNEIKALIKTAETGEQWAQICYLEKLLVDNGYKY